MPSNWFENLCAEKGLKALPATDAGNLEAGKYLFTVYGDAREIKAVKPLKSSVKVTYTDGTWTDYFAYDEYISFYAEKVVAE